jgi:hypothetical protein
MLELLFSILFLSWSRTKNFRDCFLLSVLLCILFYLFGFSSIKVI